VWSSLSGVSYIGIKNKNLVSFTVPPVKSTLRSYPQPIARCDTPRIKNLWREKLLEGCQQIWRRRGKEGLKREVSQGIRKRAGHEWIRSINISVAPHKITVVTSLKTKLDNFNESAVRWTVNHFCITEKGRHLRKYIKNLNTQYSLRNHLDIKENLS
jgi:hypothetical protein